MNTSFENYENKIDFIITNIKNNNKIIKTHKKIENKDEKIDSDIDESYIEKYNIDNIDNIDIEEIERKKEEMEKKKNKSGDKDFYCKQLDSLNYCLEMYKVRKNKKADFDIHSSQKYNIEDDNIDKQVEVLNWKDLSESFQKKLINEFVEDTSKKYNLDIKYTEIFITSNLNKIKYDKYKKKIIDLYGMINCIENNINILKIKKIVAKGANSRINKLRKSLSTSKKSRFTVSS